jgi:hypothetical protein
MADRTTTTGDVWARAACLLAAILLIGGMSAGPVVHLSAGPDPLVAGDLAGHAGEHSESNSPDAHHDCPICITLATAAAPIVPTVRAMVVAGHGTGATPVSELRDRDHADPSRARAPPHG